MNSFRFIHKPDMSSITLTLNSKKSHLHAQYFPPIDISDGEYVCGLVDFQTFHSIPNIDKTKCRFHFQKTPPITIEESIGIKHKRSIKDNISPEQTFDKDIENQLDKNVENSFVYEVDNDEQRPKMTYVELPTGAYELDQIAKYLHKHLEEHKVKLILNANKNTHKCEMYCSEDVDFSMPNSIGLLLGFQPKRYTANEWHESETVAQIFHVNIIRVECDIIRGSYINDEPAHTIHEFSLKVPPGYKIIEVPNNVIYFPVTVKSISSVNIVCVDQENQPINFQGETITVRIHIKKLNNN